MDFYKKKINRPVSNGKKEPPANLTGGNPYIFSCKSAFFLYDPCLFWTQFPCGLRHAITTESIYLHPLLNAFIGLLPRFILFVKEPSWRRIENHRSVPPLTKIFKLFRLPSVGTYVYVGVSPSFVSFLEVTTIIVVYLLFAYFPFLSFHGHAFRVFTGLSLQPLRAFTRWLLGYFF